MKNNPSSPNSISHKELNSLLNKAKKENTSISPSEIISSNKNQEFCDLISSWSETSRKILLMLNENEELVTKDRSSKSLMAFGAMGAHINLALQALKATDFDKA